MRFVGLKVKHLFEEMIHQPGVQRGVVALLPRGLTSLEDPVREGSRSGK